MTYSRWICVPVETFSLCQCNMTNTSVTMYNVLENPPILQNSNVFIHACFQNLVNNTSRIISEHRHEYFGHNFLNSLMKLLVLLTTANNPDGTVLCAIPVCHVNCRPCDVWECMYYVNKCIII